MAIWKKHYTLSQLNQICQNCAVSHLGIVFTQQGEDWLEATLNVDQRTTQPMGFLHGGVSAALAETVGSLAGFCSCDEDKTAVGIELNASHLRPVKQGSVTARATPIRLGKTLHVWQINIYDQLHNLCCSCRLTLSILNR